jgi:signal transduction histidine kinase
LSYYALGQRSVDRGWTAVDGALVAIALPGIAMSPSTAKPGDILILDIASVWAFFVVLPFVVGRVVGARRRLTDAVRANAERLVAEQQESERRAASDERTRIARELHDVIAHSVSVMVIQTQAARVLASSDRERAAAALEQVEACGRDALFDVRRMVGVLRREGGGLLAAVRPGVAQLGDLVERTRFAGLPVVLRVEGEVQSLPPSLDLAVYRLVQEALTNSLKHAGPARARVVLAVSPEFLDIRVVDTGRGAVRGNSVSAGHGLVGMRERLAVYDGSLEAGELESGGYEVHARIPLTGVMS